jgi:hypothetical protein
MLRSVVFFLTLMAGLSAQAQLVNGVIKGADLQPLEGAKVYWLGTEIGVLTDSAGYFSLNYLGNNDHRLVIQTVGYKNDTLEGPFEGIVEVVMEPIQTQTVEIEGERSGIYLGMNAHKTEVITRTELEKDACCDLAGCFNTQASVEARTTNIITNSKELQILGLSGVYNQLLLDGLPLFRGLSYTYGISGVPGPAVDKIFVAKGTASVLQGGEGVTGQINVLTLDPAVSDRLFLNIYGNSFGETQFNLQGAAKGEKWSGAWALHSAQPGMVMDRDSDTFRDMPWLRRYHALGKIQYGHEDSSGMNASLLVRGLYEYRQGGQVPALGDSRYVQNTAFSQPESVLRLHYRQNEKNKSSLFVGLQHHSQSSSFGNTLYDAKQFLGYVHAEHATVWREGQQVKFGLDYRHLDLDETVSFSDTLPLKSFAGNYLTLEQIPGLFVENTATLFADKITLITGVRADHFNQFGWTLNPRALVRYMGPNRFIARISAGGATRTPLLFSENINLLASGRDVIFESQVLPERAINLGLNLDKSFGGVNSEGRIGLDVYKTYFLQQFFPDYDRDPAKAFIGNFQGRSEGLGMQVEANCTFFERFSIRVAYNYLDVFRQTGEDRISLPFISRHKWMGAFSIWSNQRRFHFDTNWHLYGRQRLPNTDNHPAGFDLPSQSVPYVTGNFQLAAVVDRKGIVDLYAGCENVLDFRQIRPIAGWQTPFSPYFDPSFAWGPTRGREVYAGIRLRPFGRN